MRCTRDRLQLRLAKVFTLSADRTVTDLENEIDPNSSVPLFNYYVIYSLFSKRLGTRCDSMFFDENIHKSFDSCNS